MTARPFWLAGALLAAALLAAAAHAPSLVVPDIVHQTYDYRSPNFFLYLSLCCVQHYLKPARHILWVNDEGRHNKGLWEGWKRQAAAGSWEAHLAHWLSSGVIETRFLTFPSSPPGNASIFVSNKAHRSDFVRMHALEVFGGIYLDTDAFPIRPFTELRQHNFTLAFDNIVNPDPTAPKRLNNGVLLSAPAAPFLSLWRSHYGSFNPSSFDHHSSVLPYTLATLYPDLVHIEWNRLSPISFGFQTQEAAAALACGIYNPAAGTIHTPRWQGNKWSFASSTPSAAAYRALTSKLVLHLTMSQVRGLCMLRKSLGGARDLDKMPSLLGAIFRTALSGAAAAAANGTAAPAPAPAAPAAAAAAAAAAVVGASIIISSSSNGAGSGSGSAGFGWESDGFNYSRLARGGDRDRDEAWAACRNALGMHTPPDSGPGSRQQYTSRR